MIKPSNVVKPFEFHPRTRVVFGDGSLSRLGELALELGFRRVLLVADRGLVEAGHVSNATARLRDAGIAVTGFHEFDANPRSAMVGAGREVAAEAKVDSTVALGGGSSLDCAKGINFVFTNGGSMRDYRGFGKAARRCCRRSASQPQPAPAAKRRATRSF